jgi:PKD repeat protein
MRSIFLFILLSCTLHALGSGPQLSGFDGWAMPTSVEVCEGQTFCFEIYSNDTSSNPEDSLKLSWNGHLTLPPGASITFNSKRLPVATFCWSTAVGHGDSTYTFTLTATQTINSQPKSTSRNYTVIVKKNPTVNYTMTHIACGNVEFRATTDPATSTLTWEINGAGSGSSILQPVKNFDFKFETGGKFPVTLHALNSRCGRFYYDTLVIPEIKRPAFDFSADVTIGKVPLTVNFTDKTKNAKSWRWIIFKESIFLDTNTVFPNLTYTFVDTGFYNVVLFVSDSINCLWKDTLHNYIEVQSWPVSVKKKNEANNFLIYPNPTENLLIINSGIKGNFTIEFYDLHGRKIMEVPALPNVPFYHSLPTGMFFYRIFKDKDLVSTGKLMVGL